MSLSNCSSGQISQSSSTNAIEIIKKIKAGENINFSNIRIKGDIDFTLISPEYQESAETYRSEINSAIYFENCIFEGKVIAFKMDDKKNLHFVNFNKNLSFVNCQFTNEVSFRDIIAEGTINFVASKFHETVSFEGAIFKSVNISFAGTEFNEKTKFQRTYFFGNANFIKSKFNESVSFQHSEFSKEMNFRSCIVSGNCDFGSISSNESAYFNYASFNSETIFNNKTGREFF